LTQAGKTLLVPEMNMGQVSREVKRVNQGMTPVVTLNKIDGTLITPQEILAKIQEEKK
jgi:2-oxoglutarate ferredoxin oxidoreductase subunit alpha